MVNTELMLINEESIKDKIYIIRGMPVMLDRDLALIYGYSVKRLNEQVQRNIEKFPSDMMFKLSNEEMPISLKSQFATLNTANNKRGLHIKKIPYAFTEQGIYMLMTVLKGDLATKQSIELVRLFKKMKDYITNEYNVWLEHDKKINILELDMNTVNNKLDKLSDNLLLPERLKSFVISNNTRYDLDIFFMDLFKEAYKSIIVIDNYISTKTLNLFRKVNPNITIKIYTTKSVSKDSLKEFEFRDFIKDNRDLHINIYDSENKIHDRFIIFDYGTNKQRIFAIGSSIKDTGNKISTIIETKDLVLSDSFIKIINSSKEYRWNSV